MFCSIWRHHSPVFLTFPAKKYVGKTALIRFAENSLTWAILQVKEHFLFTPPRSKPVKNRTIPRYFYWNADFILLSLLGCMQHLNFMAVCLEHFIWNGGGSYFYPFILWKLLHNWWETCHGHPHKYSSSNICIRSSHAAWTADELTTWIQVPY